MLITGAHVLMSKKSVVAGLTVEVLFKVFLLITLYIWLNTRCTGL